MFVTPGSRANRKRSPSITGGSLLPIVGNGLTVTTSTPLLDLSQTWNNAAAAFTGLKFNVTNTASAAGSLLMDLQVGASSKFSVDSVGSLSLGNPSGGWGATITVSNGLVITPMFAGGSQGSLNWNNGDGVYISNPAGKPTYSTSGSGAAGLVVGRGTSASFAYVYNTTDSLGSPTNYERGVFDWTSTANVLTIGTEQGGTGLNRTVRIQQMAGAADMTRLDFRPNGSFMFTSNNVNVLQLQGGYAGFKFGMVVGFEDAGGTPDVAFSRSAAGVIEVNSTVAGTFRDLKARNYTGTGGTVTASTPLLDLSQTWNNAAVAFTALKLNVTNTASAAGSKLFDIQSGGASVLNFAVGATGLIQGAGSLTITAQTPNAQTIVISPRHDSTGAATFTGSAFYAFDAAVYLGANGFGFYGSNAIGTIDTYVQRDGAAHTIGFANGANATSLRVYNTTDQTGTNTAPTNYERGVFDWTTTANRLTIGFQKGGTGTTRSVRLLNDPANNNYLEVASDGINLWAGASFRFYYGGPPSLILTDNTAYIILGPGFDASIGRGAAKVVQIGDGNGAGGSNASGWINYAGQTRVTANFTSSNATLTAITGISSVALQAGRNYSFRAWLAVTGSSLAGVQVGITCSSTTITTLLSDGYMHDAGVMRGSSVGVINSTGTPVVAVSSATVTSSNPSIRIDGMIRVASSGLFGLTLAQSTASATQTIVSSASYMIVYDMP